MESVWISEYSKLASDYIFFAQDIFGVQFMVYQESIHSFNPETEEIEYLADSFNNWAQLVLDDFDFITGHSLASEWQKANGPIKRNSRLVPKIPFTCNGAYSVDNLFELEMTKAMSTRANFSNQIKNLPDGTMIEFEFSGAE